MPDTPNPFALTDEARKKLAVHMQGHGLPYSDAMVVVDMAILAAERCAETIVQTAHTCPPHLRLHVASLAFLVLHTGTAPEAADGGFTAEDYETIYGWGGQG